MDILLMKINILNQLQMIASYYQKEESLLENRLSCNSGAAAL